MDTPTPNNPATQRLFLVSVLGLFLELLLIRWIGTEIRIFAYLQNTVLVVCFLGLGLGCLSCRQPFVLREVVLPLSVLVLLLAIPITRHALGSISELLSLFGDMLIWNQAVSEDPMRTLLYIGLGLMLTFLLMGLMAGMFVPIGRLLGRLLDDHPRPIRAYSVNVAGSLVGIWLFVILSVLNQPPLIWLAVTAGLLLLVAWPFGRPAGLDLGLLAAIVGLGALAGWEPGALEVCWSPYQKLTLRPADERDGAHVYVVNVNNVGYQAMLDLSEKNVRAHPEVFPPQQAGLSQYDLPALLHPQPRKMLIVGAGSGNDVAGALRHSVAQIVAVEIDPAIIDMGRRLHPERPYDNPAVQVVNDDARSFFATCPEASFDVIVFGLLDAHTTTAMTNARLDHYVYTRESLRRARDLLRPGGILVLTFEVQKPFIADRMAGVLREIGAGLEPICFRIPYSPYGWGGVVFIAGDLAAARRQIEHQPRLGEAIAAWQRATPVVLTGTTPIATDDWPYIYLETPHVPVLYFCLAAMMLALFFRGLRQQRLVGLIRGWRRPYWHFFFLGAAFLLLEVQNISKATVVLGNTWWVNAVIISGILVLILVANLIVSRFPGVPLAPVYTLLCASCVALYFVDLARFALLPYAVKAVVVGGLTSLPMLFSGIVFIRSFAVIEGKDTALGANLLGALIGGLLQSVTFVLGTKALLLIVAGLYLAAFLTRPSPTEDGATALAVRG